MDPQAAFADAVARARQIAAKINQPGQPGSGDGIGSGKRPLDADPINFDEPEAKRSPFLQDPAGSYSGLNQPRNTEAAAAAAQAAARINQQLGVSSPGGGGNMQSGGGDQMGLGMVITEEFKVPDRMVGLNSAGMPDRSTTLTGTPQSIGKVKDEINKIIQRAQGTEQGHFGMGGGGGGGGEMSGNIEIMVPGNKVGLVIGKSGETIKQLQYCRVLLTLPDIVFRSRIKDR